MAAPLFSCVLRKSEIFSRVNHVVFYQNKLVSSKTWDDKLRDLYNSGVQKGDIYVGTPQQEKKHPETPARGEYELEPPKGKIFDKKPFPILLKANKKYYWCACGHSHTQPLCDGSHKKRFTSEHVREYTGHPKIAPMMFTVKEDGEYWLCNCKQTSNRPFCDGTHKREDIQKKIRG